MRRAAAALVLTLLVPLAGCGEDRVAAYCADVQSHRKQLADMVSDQSGPSALLDKVPLLRELADKAPRDLADEWQTFLNAVENLQRAVKKADVKPEDFQDGKPPAGTSQADADAVRAAADQLGEADVTQAAGAIEQQARDVCKVNFGI